MYRFRIDYSKKDSLSYTGMLDLQKIWERIFRRAKLPVAYSQGFHPLPRFHMASPLPLGFEGEHELADIWFDLEIPTLDISDRINSNAPTGLKVSKVVPVDLASPVLQIAVKEAEYSATSLNSIDSIELGKKIDTLLHMESCPRTRRNKVYDLRPLIKALELSSKLDGRIFMRLQAQEGATGRPDELIAAMDLDPMDFHYNRLNLILA